MTWRILGIAKNRRNLTDGPRADRDLGAGVIVRCKGDPVSEQSRHLTPRNNVAAD